MAPHSLALQHALSAASFDAHTALRTPEQCLSRVVLFALVCDWKDSVSAGEGAPPQGYGSLPPLTAQVCAVLAPSVVRALSDVLPHVEPIVQRMSSEGALSS